jgi:hypothetical protein
MRVLTTSSGHVMTDATKPADTPATEVATIESRDESLRDTAREL